LSGASRVQIIVLSVALQWAPSSCHLGRPTSAAGPPPHPQRYDPALLAFQHWALRSGAGNKIRKPFLTNETCNKQDAQAAAGGQVSKGDASSSASRQDTGPRS